MKKFTIIVALFMITLTTYAQSSAVYDIVFTSNWEAHGPLPGANAHFTELVGATHNSNITFLRNGGLATTGVENIAEVGQNRVFNNEVNAAINRGNADQYIQGPDLFFNTGRKTIVIRDLNVSSDYPLVSLLAMVAPSPDWMIAVNSISLVDASNQFLPTFTMDVFPYDAGTEEGNGYSINNRATVPKERISSLRGISPFNSQRIGRLVFTLKSVTNPNTCSGNINSFPYSESFEGSIGDWSQSSGDDLNWTVDANGTPSNGTGPASATAGNSYLYVEASGNGTGFPNKRAILNSPCFNLSNISNPQLSFQYHMNGSAIGNLTVEARANSNDNWRRVFSRTGAQGTGWNTAEIDLSRYAGSSSAQIRLNTITGNSWQGDIAIDNLKLVNASGGGCPTINFNDFTINSFSNQDNAGDFTVSNNGSGLSLSNNTWKSIALNYRVTANTVIEFDFRSTRQGEIHGIGFENDNTLTATNYIKVHGTQNYGITNFDNYTNGTISYTIPIGNFYTGNMNRLVFINDNDAGSGNNSTFSNVKIYEGSCGAITNSNRFDITAVYGDENEGILSKLKIYPNPVNDNFTINLKSYKTNSNLKATIYTFLGQKRSEINLTNSSTTISAKKLALESGVYLIKIENDGETPQVQKLIIK